MNTDDTPNLKDIIWIASSRHFDIFGGNDERYETYDTLEDLEMLLSTMEAYLGIDNVQPNPTEDQLTLKACRLHKINNIYNTKSTIVNVLQQFKEPRAIFDRVPTTFRGIPVDNCLKQRINSLTLGISLPYRDEITASEADLTRIQDQLQITKLGYAIFDRDENVTYEDIKAFVQEEPDFLKYRHRQGFDYSDLFLIARGMVGNPYDYIPGSWDFGNIVDGDGITGEQLKILLLISGMDSYRFEEWSTLEEHRLVPLFACAAENPHCDTEAVFHFIMQDDTFLIGSRYINNAPGPSTY